MTSNVPTASTDSNRTQQKQTLKPKWPRGGIKVTCKQSKHKRAETLSSFRSESDKPRSEKMKKELLRMNDQDLSQPTVMDHSIRNHR